ncbi:hypothetical protein DIPPA_30606 [Diplonema papillatum]|nr:hypothetical protein DIPPA_30606 [Diplonema papillatum]
MLNQIAYDDAEVSMLVVPVRVADDFVAAFLSKSASPDERAQAHGLAPFTLPSFSLNYRLGTPLTSVRTIARASHTAQQPSNPLSRSVRYTFSA